MVDIAQLVRVSGCGPEGRRFEPGYPPQTAAALRRKTPEAAKRTFAASGVLPVSRRGRLLFRASRRTAGGFFILGFSRKYVLAVCPAVCGSETAALSGESRRTVSGTAEQTRPPRESNKRVHQTNIGAWRSWQRATFGSENGRRVPRANGAPRQNQSPPKALIFGSFCKSSALYKKRKPRGICV